MGKSELPSGEHHRRRERQPNLPPYYEVARYSGEASAGEAYGQAQEAIYGAAKNDLSVYRIIYSDTYHVVVLGQTPALDLAHRLSQILSSGHPAELPANVVIRLAERRNQRIRRGPWNEGHYRPGKPL